MSTFNLTTLKQREMYAERFKTGMVSYASVKPEGQSFYGPSDWLNDFQPKTAGQALALEHFARLQDNLILFDFRAESPGSANSKVVDVVRMPRFATEVEPFTPMGEDDRQVRLALAIATGFLLVLPGETVAVVHQVDGFTFVHGACNDDLGKARELQAVYGDNLAFKATPITIRELDATRAKKVLSETTGNLMYLWEYLSEQDRALHQQQIKLLEEHIPNAPEERKDSGAIVRRSFIENGDTGSTQSMRPVSEGWVRYPTSQDAWYFGMWVNPRTREFLTYCEQDVIRVICENDQQFQLELKDAADFYGRNIQPCMKAYGADGAMHFYDALTFRSGETKTVCFHDTRPPRLAELPEMECPLMLDVDALVLRSAAETSMCDGASVTVGETQFSMNVLDPRSFAFEYHLQVKAASLTAVELTLWAAPDLLLTALVDLEPSADAQHPQATTA